MRIKNLVNGGYSQGLFNSPGGTLTGPLILAKNPNEDLEAATKLYADEKLTKFNANNISIGILQTGRLPAFTGDLISTPGTATLTLGAGNISPGAYTKITVNSKGFVTNGTGLSESDIPSLDWNKITSGKPTTLTGYGITDAVSINGGELTGNLTLPGNPVNPLHAANKKYVLDAINNNSGFSTGDIISKPTTVIPEGFLRCDGTEVNKNQYPGLLSLIGETGPVVLQPGFGQPWCQQYYINTEQTTDIGLWSQTTSLPIPITSSQAVITKNRVYLLGGYSNTGGGILSTMYNAVINEDGSLGEWTNTESLPIHMSNSRAIVIKNRVYLIGGDSTPSALDTIYTAPINTDGTLGNWSLHSQLPNPLSSFIAIVINNYLYIIGGNYLGTASTKVYKSLINSDGTLDSWVSSPDLPKKIQSAQAVVTKSRIYIIGGSDGQFSLSTVYSALINSDGSLSDWVTENNLPVTIESSQAVITRNRVYLLGGKSRYAIYTAPINSDGIIGTWSTGSNSLSAYIGDAQAAIVKDYIYLFGGYTGSYLETVSMASFAGGLSDYSNYYSDSVIPITSDTFKLPNLSFLEAPGLYYYIKT